MLFLILVPPYALDPIFFGDRISGFINEDEMCEGFQLPVLGWDAPSAQLFVSLRCLNVSAFRCLQL